MRLGEKTTNWILKKCEAISLKRNPDMIIGDEKNPVYLSRWFLKRNRFFNLYYHVFTNHDEDRALHDHPYWSLSIILKGSYYEYVPHKNLKHFKKTREVIQKERVRGQLILRSGSDPHFIKLKQEDKNPIPAFTLFVTGPRYRKWGFWCKRWMYYKDFLKNDSQEIMKGCGEHDTSVKYRI